MAAKGFDPKAQAAKENAVNIKGFDFDPTAFRAAVPKRPIYFYNVSTVEHTRRLPPNHPRGLLFQACPPDKPYVICRTVLTHPFIEYREDTNNNRFPVETDGQREATKILCPMNPGIDQNWDDAATLHTGGNLCKLGVFWSFNNPPLKEELEAARKRMIETYRKSIEKMVAIEASDGQDGARKAADRTAHAAAELFQQSYSWHRSDLTQRRDDGKIDCGVCGEKIRETAKLCVHCQAPTDPVKQAAWLEQKYGSDEPKAGQRGRKQVVIDPAQVVNPA